MKTTAVRLQKAVYDPLYYYLYSSSVALTWKQYFVQRTSLGSWSLKSCLDSLCQILDAPLDLSEPPSGKITYSNYAVIMVDLLRVVDDFVKSSSCDQEFPHSKPYAQWLKDGGDDPKYKAVHGLRKCIQGKYKHLFLNAIVHGSVATLDDAKGFSDLDLAFIVRREVGENADLMLELRKAALEILCYTNQFDPFMHHGPYYIFEQQLPCWPQSLLPDIVFKRGVELYRADDEIRYSPVDDNIFGDEIFNSLYRGFKRRIDLDKHLYDRWDLGVLLGETMILPCLYMQSKEGQYVYKGDSFGKAQLDFSEGEWRAISDATAVRNVLPARPEVSRLEILVAKNLKWPAFLRRRASSLPSNMNAVSRARELLGKDYSVRVVSLMERMQNKLLAKDFLGEKRKSIMRGYPIDKQISKGACTDLPFESDKKVYKKISLKLVKNWMKSTQPPLSVYRLGGVNTPGFSDLDYVCVYPPHVNIPYDMYRVEKLALEWQQYYVHPPYFCTPELFKSIKYWYPVSRLEHLAGEVLSDPSISDEDVPGVALGHLVDNFILKMPQDIVLHSCNPFRVRIVINTLYSFKHMVSLAERAGIAVPKLAKEYVDEINQYRESSVPFSETGFNRLPQLSDNCLMALGALLRSVESTINSFVGPLDYVPVHTVLSINDYICHCRNQVRRSSFQNTLFLTEPLAKVVSLYQRFEPEHAQAWCLYAPFTHQKIEYNENSLYLPGLKRHAAEMIRYATMMSRVGIPPLKYVGYGYCPS